MVVLKNATTSIYFVLNIAPILLFFIIENIEKIVFFYFAIASLILFLFSIYKQINNKVFYEIFIEPTFFGSLAYMLFFLLANYYEFLTPFFFWLGFLFILSKIKDARKIYSTSFSAFLILVFYSVILFLLLNIFDVSSLSVAWILIVTFITVLNFIIDFNTKDLFIFFALNILLHLISHYFKQGNLLLHDVDVLNVILGAIFYTALIIVSFVRIHFERKIKEYS